MPARDATVGEQVALVQSGNRTAFATLDERFHRVARAHGVRRLEAAPRRNQLARGRLSAQVLAPPRLFVIDTPAAAAVDLGCAYDLVVEEDGRTHLRVTSGAVSLEGKSGVAAYVLAGHEVDVLPGQRLGTPVAVDTTPAVRAAVSRLDAGDATALTALVEAAEPNDMVTLWNVVARTRDGARATAVAALEGYAQLPVDVTRAAVLAGEPAALEAWRESIVTRWLAPW